MAARRPSAGVDATNRHAETCGKPSANIITVYVLPTTGGEMKLQVSSSSKVSTLKGAISNRIKLARDKIVLLQKNRQLTEGTLEENQVIDGARLMLVPCVEAGLLASKPEHNVLNALNTLTDTQVDNVLTGRVPLNLTMRFGGHMMFIQLQLATGSPPSPVLAAPVFPPTPPSTPTALSSFPLPTTPPASPDLTIKGEPQWPVETNYKAESSPVWPQPSSHTSSSTVGHISNSNAAQELALASRHLTQTLKQLSSVALGVVAHRAASITTPTDKCQEHHCSRQQNGAVIESLYHHGKGIYSGTFVGTLSPSLQDVDGRPRPNISTIVHILNDLLGASLQCHSSAPSANGATCTCEPTSTTLTSVSTKLAQPAPYSIIVDAERQNENQAIRGKMEQLQNLLEERRQRRKARRDFRSSPYHLMAPPKPKSHVNENV